MSAFILKWIAAIAMIIDHTGMLFFPQSTWLRIIGRLAFPIYAFLIAEGCVHTKDMKKYMGRMLIFALLSQVQFSLVCQEIGLGLWHLNVLFTLLAGIGVVAALKKYPTNGLGHLIAIACIVVPELLDTDYGAAGVLTVFVFYWFREKKWYKFIGVALIHVLFFGGLQSWAIAALIPIYFYNGKPGKKMKYLFYSIYPVHLLILYLLKIWLF